MDDPRPGSKLAPEPSALGAGWSLSQSLDGALRHAKPKESLSRHLVGYRVALPEADQTQVSEYSPDDAALVARATQAGEAAWAHERIALIGRALDEEAQRLAADPQKAGKVAEHLAPLIEKAFAGALAEAPGEQARAIVGREQEPLETELLAERAVMSVAAAQRAEREGRRAALEDELAMLKTQPQRWAAAHGRRARSIDDLPFDGKRKTALKGVAARAQANAAAEGLLQQDAHWLLEDLDDPAFAGALGKDDAARWRSEAETAIARRAERVAAEGAERAQLAAADMRATLKRFKDKDDGPLPPREKIVAALGVDAANDVLSATLKGRKHRHAIGAAALLAPADEGAWLDAAPDKETRTVRELAVATKGAAVAGNPGRWLMQHSATLKELAKEATDDPVKLPRLADHYAALRNQVSGRAANDADAAPAATDAPASTAASAGADSPSDDAPLPDEVAADLVEQVLAGETPQARLDSLTTILDGAADGGSTDPDDRARADAIARQLETLGLPTGTATRWAQLSDPQTRRSARLALLGGFAKQIAEEGKILSGESEESEIVGGEGEEPEIVGGEGGDTISIEDLGPIFFPRGMTSDLYKRLIRARVDQLVKTGDVSREEADRFLADEGLTALTEIELPEETATQLYSADNNEVVAALSEFADVVLLGAEKLAELEEKYGWLAEVALRGAQLIVGGPFKTIVSIIVDRGIDAVLNEYGEEAFDRAITFVGDQFTNIFSINSEDAQKIGAATIFGLLAVTGVASGAVDTFRFARHIVRRFRNQLRWAANRPSLENEPFYRDRPETRDAVEVWTSKHGTERYTVTLTKFMESRAFRHLSRREKAWLIGMFRQDVLPRTSESYAQRLIGPLAEREDFKMAVHYVVQLPNGKSTKPDLVLFASSADPDALHRLDPFLKSVAEGFTAVVEAKGPLQRLTSNQFYLRRAMDEIGRSDSFEVGDLPISEYPPDLLRESVDVILQRYPDVKPAHAYLLVDELRKHFNPKLPVWQLLAATSGILGLIAVIGGDQTSDSKQ